MINNNNNNVINKKIDLFIYSCVPHMAQLDGKLLWQLKLMKDEVSINEYLMRMSDCIMARFEELNAAVTFLLSL